MLLNLNNLSQGCRLVRNSMSRLQRQGVMGKNILAGVRLQSCPKMTDSRVKLSLVLFSLVFRRLATKIEPTPSIAIES